MPRPPGIGGRERVGQPKDTLDRKDRGERTAPRGSNLIDHYYGGPQRRTSTSE